MGAAGAVALLYLIRFAVPHSALATPAAGRSLLIAAGWTKLLCLGAAATFALRSVLLLERGNPARLPWILLSVGLGAFTLGQATLTWYQTFLGVSPFPSWADVWFVIAYPALAIALVTFATTYTKSGFTSGSMLPLAATLTGVMAAVAFPLLRPIALTPAPPLATALNIAYPVLDLVLLIPTIVLLRLTSRFRGGAVWGVWAALLGGFVFIALGDLAFAYFSTMEHVHLDPLVHALYLIAYASLTAGAHVQYELLAPEAETPMPLAVSG
jgi:hypothetical protein